MLVSKITKRDLTPELVDRLLFQGLEDSGETGDCILVLGSIKAAQYRVPVAVSAYNAGRAGKIMLCGGAVRDFPDGTCTEAMHMRKAALELGVAEEDIIVENASRNTVENLRFGLAELQRAFRSNPVRRVLLVTTAYHMRRSLAIARHVFPEDISVIPCPADDTSTRRDNWMASPVGIARATGEAMNIVRHVTGGMIPDFEI